MEDPNAQKQVSELEQAKPETIIASIGDGVLAVDTQGIIILMNTIARQLCDGENLGTVGQHYSRVLRFIVEVQNATLSYDPIAQVMQTRQNSQPMTHLFLIRSDDTKLPVTQVAAPVSNEQGLLIGIVITFRDYSPELSLQESKDNFVSMAAHQLRARLGSVRWNMEMLLGGDYGELQEPMKDAVSQLYRGNKQLINLVNSLLNVSRIDQGRVNMQLEMTDIQPILRSVVNELTNETEQKQVKIQVSIDESFPLIYIDSIHFYDIIMNLLSNAIKYSYPNTAISLKLSHTPTEINIFVQDMGMGIPTKDQDAIFTKFFRATNAAISQIEGNGLGLFVVKSYVEELGGKIDFVSEESVGTTFRVILPLRSEPVAEMAQAK